MVVVVVMVQVFGVIHATEIQIFEFYTHNISCFDKVLHDLHVCQRNISVFRTTSITAMKCFCRSAPMRPVADFVTPEKDRLQSNSAKASA